MQLARIPLPQFQIFGQPTELLLMGHHFALASSSSLLSDLWDNKRSFQVKSQYTRIQHWENYKLCTIVTTNYLLHLSLFTRWWGGGGHAAGLCFLSSSSLESRRFCALIINQCSSRLKKQVNVRKISKALKRMDKLQDQRRGNSTSEQHPVGWLEHKI